MGLTSISVNPSPNFDFTHCNNEPKIDPMHEKAYPNKYGREPAQFKDDPKTSMLSGCKKLQFLIILIICTAVLFFQSAKCVEKYVERNKGTADKYVHISKTSFPVMTVCPTYPYKLERLWYHGIEIKRDIQFGATWVSNDSRVSPAEFYADVVLKLEEIVLSVKIYAESLIDGKNIFILGPNELMCGQNMFKKKPYYFNGDCFAFTLPDCLRHSGVLEVNLKFFDKTDIFIHHDGQFLSPNSRYFWYYFFF